MKNKDKKKNCNSTFYFIAFAAVATVAVLATIKEGRRIKRENELLAYEVW